jgi:hypothetical protein
VFGLLHRRLRLGVLVLVLVAFVIATGAAAVVVVVVAVLVVVVVMLVLVAVVRTVGTAVGDPAGGTCRALRWRAARWGCWERRGMETQQLWLQLRSVALCVEKLAVIGRPGRTWMV